MVYCDVVVVLKIFLAKFQCGGGCAPDNDGELAPAGRGAAHWCCGKTPVNDGAAVASWPWKVRKNLDLLQFFSNLNMYYAKAMRQRQSNF